MRRLTEDLKELMAIPSVSAAGYPEPTHAALRQAQRLVTKLFAEAGYQQMRTIDLPG